ncbi:hypothetical protein [Ruegeria meonggei]|uniref:Uncharacterized protein n=1 Tax=Ruegeria meonggei TaxID=1446476 RepID=A0A1X6ZLT2_9RHOB|nr:hypothetical protein [Ruegeria meonggei]SLN55424.1 hypothetical protein RUM8411_02694 [Ruegeria meonggei]
MADNDNEPTIVFLNEIYPFLSERRVVRIYYPPGTCTKQSYSFPYVVLAATSGVLSISINGETPMDQVFEPGDHYARKVPEGLDEFTVEVCNNTDSPIIIFKDS